MERHAYRATSQLALLAEMHQRDLLDDATRRRRATLARSERNEPADGLLARMFGRLIAAAHGWRATSRIGTSKAAAAPAARCN